jgi:hypothetical protein
MPLSAPAPPATPSPSPRRPVVVGVLAAVVLAMLGVLAVVVLGPATSEPGPALYVSPAGDDTSDGLSAVTPLASIQKALEKATAGSVITLAPGVYHEQPQTVRDGAPGLPIVIRGPEAGTDRAGRYRAVLYGTGRIVNVDHSWITLQGFTIDGQEQLANTPLPTALGDVDAFKQSVQDRVEDSKLVYVGANDDTRDVTGVTIDDMFLSSSGGECVRLRNNAHDNRITNSVIQYCGLYGKDGSSDAPDKGRSEFHNGEGVYIGTSPKSADQPMSRNDASSHNVVAHNVIRTFGSECFNIKENAHDNVFEDNVCAANTEPARFEGSNVELRGYRNIVRNNQISDSAGYAIKIQSDAKKYDKGGNVVENNRLSGAAAAAFTIRSNARQGRICGNVVAGGALFDADGATPQSATSPC